MNARLVADLAKAVLRAPLARVAPTGVRNAVRDAVAKVLSVAHKTNASGNNMSQR
jgi:hypothetical protein